MPLQTQAHVSVLTALDDGSAEPKWSPACGAMEWASGNGGVGTWLKEIGKWRYHLEEASGSWSLLTLFFICLLTIMRCSALLYYRFPWLCPLLPQAQSNVPKQPGTEPSENASRHVLLVSCVFQVFCHSDKCLTLILEGLLLYSRNVCAWDKGEDMTWWIWTGHTPSIACNVKYDLWNYLSRPSIIFQNKWLIHV